MGAALSRVRPDIKLMTNYLLAALPELEKGCIFVDPFRQATSTRANIAPMKQATSSRDCPSVWRGQHQRRLPSTLATVAGAVSAGPKGVRRTRRLVQAAAAVPSKGRTLPPISTPSCGWFLRSIISRP